MSDYPPSEHTMFVDFMETPLPNMLMAQQERVINLEAEARRWSEGLAYLEWTVSRYPAQHSAHLTPAYVLQMLGDVTVYASVGRGSEWIEKACEEMGRS